MRRPSAERERAARSTRRSASKLCMLSSSPPPCSDSRLWRPRRADCVIKAAAARPTARGTSRSAKQLRGSRSSLPPRRDPARPEDVRAETSIPRTEPSMPPIDNADQHRTQKLVPPRRQHRPERRRAGRSSREQAVRLSVTVTRAAFSSGAREAPGSDTSATAPTVACCWQARAETRHEARARRLHTPPLRKDAREAPAPLPSCQSAHRISCTAALQSAVTRLSSVRSGPGGCREPADPKHQAPPSLQPASIP